MEPKKPIVNEEEQNEPLNPMDNAYENTGKLKGYKEGNHDDSTSGNGQDGLPGQDDDSGKTIRETPRMDNK